MSSVATKSLPLCRNLFEEPRLWPGVSVLAKHLQSTRDVEISEWGGKGMMRRWVEALLVMLVLSTVALLAGKPSSTAIGAVRDPRLARVHSWSFAAGDGALLGSLRARYAPFDLVVLDGEAASASQVSLLRGMGKVVLAYVSVGTIERYRSWYAAAAPYRLDYWGDWGEWYADTSHTGYRDLMTHHVAPALLAKGFNGLFLDNTDMIADHPRQRAGMIQLVHALALLVHRRHDFLFTQNGEGTIGPMLHDLDGWNREDVTSTYDFGSRGYRRVSADDSNSARQALRDIAAAGLLVTAIDYARADDSAAIATSVRNTCQSGALPYVSDINLTRVPAHAYRCPSH